MKTQDESYCEIRVRIADIVEEFKESLPVQAVMDALICAGVTMGMCCAPNELEGMKAIMECIKSGLVEYEETHS